MKRTLGCLLAAAALFALSMPAAQAQTQRGVGNVLCRDFLRAARMSDMLYQQASNWILGYVSGMNNALLASKGTSAAAGLSNDQLLKSAGDYCEANPGATIAAAANQWYGTLPQQAEAPKPVEPGAWYIDLNKRPDRKFSR